MPRSYSNAKALTGSGTGDVVGPVSSTDNAIARWNGTAGDTIQNSAAFVDDNGNVYAPNTARGYATTATAAGTTTLTVASKGVQTFTGATTQIVALPAVSTLPQTGFGYWIINNSSGAVTVNSSGGNAVQVVAAGGRVVVLANALSGTGASVWDKVYWLASSGDVATDAIFDAKGDLPAGTGANTAAKRTVGADGTVLKANSAQATGLEWGSLSLDNLSDVAISSPQNFHIIRHNGSNFENANLLAGDMPSGIDAGNIANGSVSDAEFQYLNGAASNIQDQLDAKAADSAVVHNTGNETVAGIKTFSSSPVVPAPTTDLQAATKKYVDDAVTAGGGYTDEAAQDAVGSILVDSAEIDFTYSDATPSISASLVAGSIDETKLDASVNASLAGELTANTQTGTTYSLVVGDKGKEVRMTNAAAKTVTVDPTSGLTTGFVCIVGNYGAGAMTIAPGSGVTLRGYLWKVPQYGKAAIRAIGTDEFIVDILPNEAMVTLTDGATVTIDPKLGKRHYLSTANSRTIANGTAGLYDGQPLTVKILNSSGGSVTPTFDTGATNKFRFNGTLTVASAIAAGKTRYWTCSYNTADTRWDILAESGEF